MGSNIPRNVVLDCIRKRAECEPENKPVNSITPWSLSTSLSSSYCLVLLLKSSLFPSGCFWSRCLSQQTKTKVTRPFLPPFSSSHKKSRQFTENVKMDNEECIKMNASPISSKQTLKHLGPYYQCDSHCLSTLN